jgi:hypothetical protein
MGGIRTDGAERRADMNGPGRRSRQRVGMEMGDDVCVVDNFEFA